MGTHRAGPPAGRGDAVPEPRLLPADDPAPTARPATRTRADRKAERLAKAERAVAEYARKDGERAERKAARRQGADQGPIASRATSGTSSSGIPSDTSLDPQPDAVPVAAGGWFDDGDDPGGSGGSGPAKARKAKEPRERRPPNPKRRRRQALIATFVVIGLAAAAGGGLAVANFAESAGGEGSTQPPPAVLSPAGLTQLTSVPAGVLDEVGAGSAVALLGRVNAPAQRSGSKPRLLYIGAESCPLCAAERWPLVVALSRFGTWRGLGVILSPKDEVFPDTPTLSFHGATYTSKYLVFSGFETTGWVRTAGQYPPLDVLSAADATTLRTVRVAPFVPEEDTGKLPFLDLGGKFVGAGTHVRAAYLGLFAGNTPDQVAAALSKPASALAKAIDGGANAITAAICEVLPKKTRPIEICSSPAVKAGKSILRAKRG